MPLTAPSRSRVGSRSPPCARAIIRFATKRAAGSVRPRPSSRLGLTEGRIGIAQWLFVRYGGRFVFIARFLPFLRNMAAVLAGTNSMAQQNFYFASGLAAVAWVMGYGLAAYSLGESFMNF